MMPNDRNVGLRMADADQVRAVIEYWGAAGCSLRQALARMHVPAGAFWARMRRAEPALAALFKQVVGQWVFTSADAVLEHAERMVEETGHAAWGAIRQKQVLALGQLLRGQDVGAADMVGVTSQEALERVARLLADAREREFLARATRTDDNVVRISGP